MIAAGTDDRTFRPEMCAVGVRALADEFDTARARGRRIDADKFHRLAAALVDQAEGHVLLGLDEGVTRPAADHGIPRPVPRGADAPA